MTLCLKPGLLGASGCVWRLHAACCTASPAHPAAPRLLASGLSGRRRTRLLPSTSLFLFSRPLVSFDPVALPMAADYVGDEVPRLLINREKAGELTPEMRALGYRRGFNFGDGNYRRAPSTGSRLVCAASGARQRS